MNIDKSNIHRFLYASFGILFLVISFNIVNAQHVDTISRHVESLDIKSSVIEKDSLFNKSLLFLQQSTNKKKKELVKPIVFKSHSAQKALLLSLIPGAGQIYNHQAWKIPIIYTALGVVGYFVYDNYTQMSTFKKEYLFRVNNPGSVSLEGYESYPNASIYNLYQSYNQNFQLMIIITAGVYVLNLIDAFVFGHLFDFQINDNLAISVYPLMQSLRYVQPVVPTLGFSFRF